MQYTFQEVATKYPKRTNRSKRAQKKMHLNKFGEVLVDINIPIAIFDNDKEAELIDAIYEFDDNAFVFGSTYVSLMHQRPVSEFNREVIIQYCDNLLRTLSEIDPQFAEVEKVTITYGDAYYGEW